MSMLSLSCGNMRVHRPACTDAWLDASAEPPESSFTSVPHKVIIMMMCELAANMAMHGSKSLAVHALQRSRTRKHVQVDEVLQAQTSAGPT